MPYYLFAAVVAIDFFIKWCIIDSTHRRRHVASETEFKQDSPNPNSDSDSLIECTFYWIRIRIHYVSESIRSIEYPLKRYIVMYRARQLYNNNYLYVISVSGDRR